MAAPSAFVSSSRPRAMPAFKGAGAHYLPGVPPASQCRALHGSHRLPMTPPGRQPRVNVPAVPGPAPPSRGRDSPGRPLRPDGPGGGFRAIVVLHPCPGAHIGKSHGRSTQGGLVIRGGSSAPPFDSFPLPGARAALGCLGQAGRWCGMGPCPALLHSHAACGPPVMT